MASSLQTLPADIRRLIYCYTGARRVCPIDIKGERVRINSLRGIIRREDVTETDHGRCSYYDEPGATTTPNQFCDCDELPTALLYTCHGIYDEVAEIIYGRNKFDLRLPFYKLVSTAIQRMTSLQIQVHEEIGIVELQDYDMGLWTSLCNTLRTCRPEMNLIIISECFSYEGAVQLLAPLQEIRVNQCSIRLRTKMNPELEQLAERVACQVTGKVNKFTLFSNLPIEIQEHIIRQTVSADGSLELDKPVHNSTIKHTGLHRSHSCCSKCTANRSYCTCPTRHAAYTTRVCRCWEFPISLFLTNRRIGAIAKRLFCKENRFHLWDTSHTGERSTYLDRIHEALQSLHNLSYLSLSFRSFQPTDCLPERPEFEAWDRIGRTVKLMHTERLTLILYVMPMDPELDGYPSNWSDNKRSWESQQLIVGRFRHATYKNFFVFISSPMYFDFWDDLARWERERELERMIMGQEHVILPRKYKYMALNEETGPRRFWYDKFGLSKAHARRLDLDDPLIQRQLLNGSLNGLLQDVSPEPLREPVIKHSYREL